MIVGLRGLTRRSDRLARILGLLDRCLVPVIGSLTRHRLLRRILSIRRANIRRAFVVVGILQLGSGLRSLSVWLLHGWCAVTGLLLAGIVVLGRTTYTGLRGTLLDGRVRIRRLSCRRKIVAANAMLAVSLG